MKKKPKRRDSGRWITVERVWHWRAKRYITRRDGKPFRFRLP